MPQLERDFLKRQLQRFAALVGEVMLRVRAREEPVDPALDRIRRAAGDAFGLDYATLDMIDSRSAADLLLRDPETIRALAWLSGEEAELYERKGHQAGAASKRRRALELYVEALSRIPEPEPDLLAAVRALRERTDPELLSERYRDPLEALLSAERPAEPPPQSTPG